MHASMYFRSLYFFHIFVSACLLRAFLISYFVFLVYLRWIIWWKVLKVLKKKNRFFLRDEMWEVWCGSGFYLKKEALKFQKYFPYFKSY